MTLSHPSVVRAVIGLLLVLTGGALFVVSAIAQSEVMLYALVAFACFVAGLIIVFVNADETITLHKPSGTAHHHQKSFRGTTHATHALDDASHVEIANVGHKKHPEVFIVFKNGNRVRIDYAHKPGADPEALEATIASRVAQFLAVPLTDASAE